MSFIFHVYLFTNLMDLYKSSYTFLRIFRPVWRLEKVFPGALFRIIYAYTNSLSNQLFLGVPLASLGSGFPLILLSAFGGCGVSAAIPNATPRRWREMSFLWKRQRGLVSRTLFGIKSLRIVFEKSK